MSVNILNGTLADIKSAAGIVIFIDANGFDLSSGIRVLDGTPAQIKSAAEIVIPIDSNGDVL